MPAPIQYDTPGPAQATSLSEQPGFTQGLGRELTTPGRQERPRLERAEQLRGLLAAAGSAVVGAVGSKARIQAIAKARAEERRAETMRLSASVKQRKDDQLNERERAYKLTATERVKEVERTQFDILRDPRSENNEWVMNQAVIAQNNARLPEEKDAWMDFIVRHQDAARRDAKVSGERSARVANAELISDRRIAANTAKNAIDDLWNEVQKDPTVKTALIGDGNGINDRVQEHVIRTAMEAAPQLFSLNEDDPLYVEKLQQQTILLDELENRAQQTIVDPLTRQFVTDSSKASETTGFDRIDIASQAFAEERLSASEYHDVVGDVMRTQFAHVDPRQRDTIRQKLYEQQFNNLAGLLSQRDPGKALKAMEDLLSVADLSPTEREIIRNEVISDKFPKSVSNRLQEMYRVKAAEMSGIARVASGDSVVPRDPRVISIEMLENGTFADMAGQLLSELGVQGDPSTMTPLQANLFSTVWATMEEAASEARQSQARAGVSVNRATRFIAGGALSNDDAGDQWREGGLMRMLDGRLSPDDPVFQSIGSDYESRSGKVLEWDGSGPVPLTRETIPLVNEIARQEADLWRKNPITNMPRAMADTIENLALHDSPERAHVALSFWNGLGSEGQERLAPLLSARAQMALMEGARLAQPGEVSLSMTEVAARMRVLDQNASIAALRLAKEHAALGDVTPNPNFQYDYARALSSALGRDVLKSEYGAQVQGFDVSVPGTGFGAATSASVSGLSQVLGNRQALVPLFAQMAVVLQANPGTTLDQAATVVAARMREGGYKVIDGRRGPQIAKDPWGHYPIDVTPEVILRNDLDRPRTQGEIEMFIAKFPAQYPEVQAMARDGENLGNVLWSWMDRERQSANPDSNPIPPPRDWLLQPETAGPIFEGTMSQEEGGVPMHVLIPGTGRTQLLVDNVGNPLLVSSSKRRYVEPKPVDKSKIPDNFLTPEGRRKIKLKPDAAERIEGAVRESDLLVRRRGQAIIE